MSTDDTDNRKTQGDNCRLGSLEHWSNMQKRELEDVVNNVIGDTGKLRDAEAKMMRETYHTDIEVGQVITREDREEHGISVIGPGGYGSKLVYESSGSLGIVRKF